jgi:hypothetical protein
MPTTGMLAFTKERRTRRERESQRENKVQALKHARFFDFPFSSSSSSSSSET